MFDSGFFQRALLAGPVILFSLTVHEYFHAWSAYKFGDPTAKNMGRLTLNPLKHLEFFGVLVMVVTQFQFGWAKPVPVDPRNFRNPRSNDIWVSAAGPLSNVGLAIIAAAIFRIVGSMNLNLPPAAYSMLQFFVFINLALAVFNCIPLFPLDGSHILRNLAPERYDGTFDMIDRVAPFLLLILLITGGLTYIIWPPVSTVGGFLLGYR